MQKLVLISIIALIGACADDVAVPDASASLDASRMSDSGTPDASSMQDAAAADALIAEDAQNPGDASVADSSTFDAPIPTDRVGRLLASPDRIGFGAATTGGALAESFTVVSTLADSGPGSLRDAMSQETPLWIIFDPSIAGGTINLRSGFNVQGSDITIDGSEAGITLAVRGNAEFVVFAFRGGNTILHDITLDGNGSASTAIMTREGDLYWIDHVTVTGFRDDALSVGQGSRPETSASEITVSNYLAQNTGFGLAIGGNDNFPTFPTARTTIHRSILSADDRNPRVQRGGEAHVFNTYVHSNRNAGMDAGRTGQIISENNVLSALEAINPSISQTGRNAGDGPTGHVFSEGDIFLDVAGSSGSINPRNVTPFSIPYDYDPLNADEVVEYVLRNAGARSAE